MKNRVYLIGIGGIGMSGVGGLLKELGYEVAGFEKLPIYPPASEILKKSQIRVYGYDETGIEKFRPDYVIVGNAIKKEHPEVKKAIQMGLFLYSFPEFLEKHVLKDKQVLLCAGTHGKSTTTALLGFLLEKLGEDPFYLVGAVQKHSGLNYRTGKKHWFVIEGDEYPSSFFDKKAKFLHYNPFAIILTSLERDHIDAYPEYETLKETFFLLLKLLPEEGILIFNEDSEDVKKVVKNLNKQKKIKKIISYGKSKNANFRLISSRTSFSSDKGFLNQIKVKIDGKEKEYFLKIPGEHNALNSVGVLALLYSLGFDIESVLKLMKKFPGIKRRQEIIFSEGPVVIDDFAHHPTAVKLTLSELRKAIYADKVVLVFEPRTNSSKRKVFQKEYEKALSLADIIFIKIPPGFEKIEEKERLNIPALISALEKSGKRAQYLNLQELKKFLEEKNNLIVFMSSGSFEEEFKQIFSQKIK